MDQLRKVTARLVALMNEGTLLRRSLVLTGVLVTVASIWITAVSMVLVSLVDRTLAEPERASSSAAAAPRSGGTAPLSQTRRAPSDNGSTAPAKPNG